MKLFLNFLYFLLFFNSFILFCYCGCYPPYDASYSSSCYYLTPTAQSRLAAQLECNSNQGWLVTIFDRGEENFLNSQYLSSTTAWIGIVYTSGYWQWDHPEDTSFTNWAPSEPDNLPSDYYASKDKTGWKSTATTWNYQGICETSATSSPTKLPTKSPTRSPTGNPTKLPSCAPTQGNFFPTITPTIQMVINPTVVPSNSPTLIPTTAPTILPTTTPTIIPTAIPTVIPTSPPTIIPTSPPTIIPTNTPTIQPTSPPTIIPTIQPTLSPTSPPTIQPTKIPSSSPTITPTIQPTTQPTLSPSLFVTKFPTSSPTITPTSNPTSNPTLNPTTNPSTNPTSNPTVNPSIKPTSIPSINPTLKPTSLPTISPTLPTSAPDIIFSRDPKITKNSITLSITLSDSGSVYCAAYLTSTLTPTYPLSTNEVLIQQQMISLTSSPYQGSLTINSLYPDSIYNIYCASISSIGSFITPYNQMIEKKKTITTSCCKQITVSLSGNYFAADSIINNAIYLYVDSPPASDSTITLSLTSITSPKNILSSSLLYPSSVYLTSLSTSSWINPISIALNHLPSDEYSLNVQNLISREYTILFSTYVNFKVETKDKPLPPPKLTQAIFSSTGDKITIQFDTLTDKCKTFNSLLSLTRFTCSLLFNFQNAEYSNCEWIDDSSVLVTFQSMNNGKLIQIYNSITLLSNKLRAKCNSINTTFCSNWLTSTQQSVSLLPPTSPIIPTVVLSLPSYIGLCNLPIFDISGSTGSGGRDWYYYKIITNVIGIDNNSTKNTLTSNQLNKFFNESFTISPPSSIPRSLFIDGVIEFHVTLCNFLNSCGITTTQMKVNSNPIPSVIILGNKFRTYVSSDIILLQAKGRNYLCDNTYNDIDTKDLIYNWIIKNTQNNKLVNFTSTSTDPSKLKLQSYTLQSGFIYLITVTVINKKSLLNSTTSIQVSIQSGTIIPIISGASIQSIEVNSTQPYIIDGSLSYDQNSPKINTFLYTWLCYQSYPIITTTTCPLTLFSKNSSILVTANNVIIGSKYTITLQITEKITSRISQQISIELDVIPPYSPRINIYYNQQQKQSTLTTSSTSSTSTSSASSLLSYNKINSNDELVLNGIITLFTSNDMINKYNNTLATWSIDDTTIDLESSTLGNIEINLNSIENVINLILIPNTLIGRTNPYIFSLSINSNGNDNGNGNDNDNGIIKSSISIYVNSNPIIGQFNINPLNGYELNTTFLFFASRYTDDDLPLTYQYSYLISSADISLIFKSRSELTSTQSYLPSGQDTQNWNLQCELMVFDNLDASVSSYKNVQVKKNQINNVQTNRRERKLQLNTINSIIPTENTDVDTIHSSININSAILNSINCSNAPDCRLLYRDNCGTITNTCGNCLEGYIGVEGNDNTPCISTEGFSDSSITSINSINSAYNECETIYDCFEWYECINHTCIQSQQQCIEPNCSGNGICQYIDVNTGQLLTNCYLNDPYCKAECKCNSNYVGYLCENNINDIELIQLQTDEMLIETLKWITIDDLNENSLLTWINTLQSLSLSYYSLSTLSTKLIRNITLIIVEKSSVVNLYHDNILPLYKIIDQTISILYIYNDIDLNPIFQVLDQITNTLVQDMTIGQSNIISILDNIRVNNIVSDNLNQPLLLTIPQTNLEIYSNIPQSSCQISSSLPFDSSLSLSLTSTINLGYSLMSYPLKLNTNQSTSFLSTNKTLISNTIRLSSYNTTSNLPIKLFNQNITITLQHTQEVIQPINVNITFNTTCKIDTKETLSYLCTYINSTLNYTLYHHCNGTSNYILYSQCPELIIKPSCESLLLSTKSIYKCNVLSFTSFNTTCLCSATNNKLSRRSLLNYKVDNNNDNNDNNDNGDDESDALDVSITLQTELTEFYYTWSTTSTEYNSIKDLQKTLLIIIMYGSLWFIGLISVSYCYYKRQVRERIKTLETKMKSQGIKSMKKFTSLDSQNFLEKYISSIFPLVFREDNYWKRLYSEIVTHHRYLIPFYARGDNSENIRMLTVINVLTIQSMLMFILAVLYDTEYPNQQDICDSYYTESDCLSEKSPYDSSHHICEWKYHEKSNEYTCDYIVPEANYQTMIFFSIGVSILTAPINLLVDFLFIDILSAPTIESLSKVEKSEERAKLRVGANRSRLERSSSSSSQLSDLSTSTSISTFNLINPIDFNFKETIILPSQTREAQFIASVTSEDVLSEVWKLNPDTESPLKKMKSYKISKFDEIDEESPQLNKERDVKKKKYEEQEMEQEEEQEEEEIPKINKNKNMKNDRREKRRSDQKEVPKTTLLPTPKRSIRGISRSSSNFDESINPMLTLTQRKELVELQYKNFLNDIRVQRTHLSLDQQSIFDRTWCIDSNCDFVFQGRFSVFKQYQKMPNQIMKSEMMNVINEVESYREKFHKIMCDTPSIGLEILHLFVVDLLGRDTACAKIFKNKAENDFRRTLIVSKYSKVIAWIVVILLNFIFIYYSLLRGLERGYNWQKVYVFACMIQLVVEILFYETSECLIIQFLIPNTAKSEIQTIVKLFHSLIKQICQHIDTGIHDDILLNSSKYFFVSTNLALLYPNLCESAIVCAFRSYLPGPIGMKWNHILSLNSSPTSNPTSSSSPPSSSSTTSNNQSNLSICGSFITFQLIWMNVATVMIYFTQYLASLPPLLQRLFVHSVQPLIVAFILILWVQLLKNPIYFAFIFGGLVIIGMLKLIHRVMKQSLIEKNSLKFSLKIVTEYTNELTKTSLEPSTSAILWAQPNPLNSSTNINSNSSTNLYAEEDNPNDDEEKCIEMKSVTRSRVEI